MDPTLKEIKNRQLFIDGFGENFDEIMAVALE